MFLSISHKMLASTQRWARNGCSGELELAQDKTVSLWLLNILASHGADILPSNKTLWHSSFSGVFVHIFHKVIHLAGSPVPRVLFMLPSQCNLPC